MLPSSSGLGRQPPQAGNGGSNPSGSAISKRGRPKSVETMVHTSIVLPRRMRLLLRLHADLNHRRMSDEIRARLANSIGAGSNPSGSAIFIVFDADENHGTFWGFSTHSKAAKCLENRPIKHRTRLTKVEIQ